MTPRMSSVCLLCVAATWRVSTLSAGPDLVITDVWNDGGIVRYQILNAGDAYSPSGHDTHLRVNGYYAMTDWNLPTLKPGQRADRFFDKYTWHCGAPSDTIEVIADADNEVLENDEKNNTRTETWKCDTTAPRIVAGPAISELNPHDAKITWQTDEPTRGAILFGRRAGTVDAVLAQTELRTDHEIRAKDLEPGVTYHVRARSVDESDNTTLSETLYFTTPVPPDGAGPAIGQERVLRTEVPLEFEVPASDPSGVELVRFFLDGRLVETDYSEPFLCSLIPHELGLSPSEFFGAHTLTAEARDSGGELTTLPIYVEPRDLCWPAELDFEFPYEGYEILVDGTMVPAEESPLWVRVRASATPWRQVVRFGEVIEMGTPLDRIELYVEGELLHVERDAESMTHPIPITGWALGDYDIKIRLCMEGCIPLSATHTVHIRRRRAQLELASREVVREGSVLSVTLEFYNAGSRDAILTRFDDNVTGFQVLPHPGGDMGFWPDITTRSTRVQWQKVGGQRIAPGHRWTFTYDVIPVLYLGFASYAMGQEDVSFIYEDDTGRGSSYTAHRPAGSATLSDLVNEAFAASDYLIVTSPGNIVRHADEAGWRGLSRSIGKLAKARGAVLGYYEAGTVLATAFDASDRIAVGSMFGCPNRDEVFVADEEEDRICIYDLNGEIIDEVKGVPIPHPDLDPQDAMVVGNVQGHAGTATHPEDEIVVLNGHFTGPSLGQATTYKYFRDSDRFSSYSFNTDYQPGDVVAVGDVLHTPNWPEEELVIAHGDGTMDVHEVSRGEVHHWSSLFRSGDLLAVGNVVGDSYDEIIVGDVSDNRLIIYEGDGTEWTRCPLPAGRALSENDDLAVRDVLGASGAEILVADASENRVYVYRYYERVGALLEVSSFAMTYHDDDRVLLGNLMGLAKSQFIHACGTRRNQRMRGDVEIAPFSDDAEAPGDRYTLDRLFECDGAWARKLAPGWCDGGYLLIVGETRIIPAFSAKYGDVGKGDKIIEFTDNFYANTAGHEKQPELCIGRIIGNEPERLRAPIEATLGILDGTRDFNQSHALIISGRPRGANGTATWIDFYRERNRIERRIDDNWSHTTELDEPSETEWIDAMVGKDVIHLAAHGWDNGMDVLNDTTVRDTWDPGVTAPLVFANSCLTGRYPPTRCLGERFLNHGASAYIGATEVSYGPYCRYLAEGFWERFDVGYTAGRALKEAKRNRMGDTSYAKYNSAIYHLYGDPKLEPVVAPPSEKDVPPPPADNDIQGPVGSVQVKVPMYEVDSYPSGEQEATIPGGDMLLVPGRPMVPCYPVMVHFPAGYQVQDVRLGERGGLSTDSLNLPIAEAAEYDLSTPPQPPDPDDEWFPSEDLQWSIVQEPDDGTTLMIRLYPFQANPSTTHVRFWDTCNLEIDYVSTSVRMRHLAVERGSVAPGEAIRWDMAVENTGLKVTDVLVESVIRTPDDTIVAGLPIRRLRSVQGLATLEQEWNSGDCDPDFLTVEVSLRSMSGCLVDRRAVGVTLGRAEVVLDSVVVNPPCFEADEGLTITATGRSIGERPTGGTVVVAVHDDQGGLVEQLSKDFTDVAPGEPIVAALPYKATLPRGRVTLRTTILYEGVATDVVIWPPVGAEADGDLTGDGRVGLADFAILAAAWLDYIEQADIAPPGGDCRVDQLDLLELAQQWMSM